MHQWRELSNRRSHKNLNEKRKRDEILLLNQGLKEQVKDLLKIKIRGINLNNKLEAVIRSNEISGRRTNRLSRLKSIC
jgi:hypothetical protein